MICYMNSFFQLQVNHVLNEAKLLTIPVQPLNSKYWSHINIGLRELANSGPKILLLWHNTPFDQVY